MSPFAHRRFGQGGSFVSSSDLIRWGGAAATLSGVVWVTQGLLALTAADPDTAGWLDALFVVAVLLALVGLVGLRPLQKGSYERAGRTGFYTVIGAFVAQTLGLVGLLAGSEALIWPLPSGSLGGVLVGFVLYGVATLQARVLACWCAMGLVVGGPVTTALGYLADILFGLLWLALGCVLWSQRGQAAQVAPRTS